jgi:hypothetical protein
VIQFQHDQRDPDLIHYAGLCPHKQFGELYCKNRMISVLHSCRSISLSCNPLFLKAVLHGAQASRTTIFSQEDFSRLSEHSSALIGERSVIPVLATFWNRADPAPGASSS